MSSIFLILAVLSAVAVLVSLGGGLVTMARAGEANAKYGNWWMRSRILFQGAALVFFLLAVLSS